MTTKSFRGLLAATATIAVLAASPASAADQPKLSASVSKPLAAAQKAAAAKDWATAAASLKEAQAVSGKTPFDDYTIDKFGIFIGANSGDMVAAEAAAEAAAASPAEPDADKQGNLNVALSLALNNKNYDKATASAKALAATNPTDPKMILNINQAYYFGKDYPDAIASLQKSTDADIAAGRKPDRGSLQMLLSAQAATKDETAAEKTLEILVADYNDPADWAQMIDVAISTKGVRDLDEIWLGRLLFLTGATVTPSDASLIGSTASHLTFFGDAQAAQQHGGSGFPDAKAKADADKKSMPQQIAAGAKQGGQYNAKLAEALYSYGMYPEAQAAAETAMAKGGATDSSEAPMVLGQALTAQGKYDEAIAAFGKVTGGGPATARITRLWVDYANIKKSPGAAPVAAAH